MDVLLQGVGGQQPRRDSNAAFDRARGSMIVQQFSHGLQRRLTEALAFRRRPALELRCGDLEPLKKLAAIERDGLLQTLAFRSRRQSPKHLRIDCQRRWVKTDRVLMSD